MIVVLLVAFFSFANARVHEIMGTAPNHLKRISDSNSETDHEIVIAVHQRNIEVIEKMLLRKSTPGKLKLINSKLNVS
jgi:hypothetical protein